MAAGCQVDQITDQLATGKIYLLYRMLSIPTIYNYIVKVYSVTL